VILLVMKVCWQLKDKMSFKRMKRRIVPLLVAIIADDGRGAPWTVRGVPRAFIEDELRSLAAAPKKWLQYSWRNDLRAAVKASMTTLALLPLWSVKISAVARCGRIPGLFQVPYYSWWSALSAVVAAEGALGLFKGGVPLCAVSILQSILRARRRHSRFLRRVRFTPGALEGRSPYSASPRMKPASADAAAGVGIPEPPEKPKYAAGPSRWKPEYDPWERPKSVVYTVLRHPFELLSLRLITSDTPQYSNVVTAVNFHWKSKSLSDLFIGVRQSLFGALFLPDPSRVWEESSSGNHAPKHHWLWDASNFLVNSLATYTLINVPFLIRIRRMLFSREHAHDGMGGSLELMSEIIQREGVTGIFAGFRAGLGVVLPSLGALLLARTTGWLLFGTGAESRARAAIQEKYFRQQLSSGLPGEKKAPDVGPTNTASDPPETGRGPSSGALGIRRRVETIAGGLDQLGAKNAAQAIHK